MQADEYFEQQGVFQNLVARYAAALDNMAFSEWLALFTTDATYRVITQENYEKKGMLCVIDDDRESMATRCNAHDPAHLETSNHAISNLRGALLDEQSARLSASLLVSRFGQTVFTGKYQMQLRRVHDHWLIQSCLIVLDGDTVPQYIQVPI